MSGPKREIYRDAGGETGALGLLDGRGEPFWNASNGCVLSMVSRNFSGDRNERAHEIMMGEIKKTAIELAGPDPSPAVVTLAQSAALCLAEYRFAQVRLHEAGEFHIDILAYREKRAERCANRYHRTLKTLAEVKRLEGKSAVRVEVVRIEPAPQGLEVAEPRLSLVGEK